MTAPTTPAATPIPIITVLERPDATEVVATAELDVRED
jgi:hypothetical protein